MTLFTFRRPSFREHERRMCFVAPPPGEGPKPEEKPEAEKPKETEKVDPATLEKDVANKLNKALERVKSITKQQIEQMVTNTYEQLIANCTADPANAKLQAMGKYLKTPEGKQAFAAAAQKVLERKGMKEFRISVTGDGAFTLEPVQANMDASKDTAPLSIDRMSPRLQNLAKRYKEGMRDEASFSPVDREYIENAFMQQGMVINADGTATPVQGSFGRGLTMLVGMFRGLAWEMQNGRGAQGIRTRLEGAYTPRDYIAEYNGDPNRIADIAVGAEREVIGDLRPGETGPPAPKKVRDVTITPRATGGQTPKQIGAGLFNALKTANVPGVTVNDATGVVSIPASTPDTLRTIATVLQRLANPDAPERSESLRAGKEKDLRDAISGVSLLPEAGRENIKNAIALTKTSDGKFIASVNMAALEAPNAMSAPVLAEIRALFPKRDATLNRQSTEAIAAADIDVLINNVKTKLTAVHTAEVKRASLEKDFTDKIQPMGCTDISVATNPDGKYVLKFTAPAPLILPLTLAGFTVTGTQAAYKPSTEAELRTLLAAVK